MVIHGNLNALLKLHFREGTEREIHKIQNHVSICESCRDYLSELEKTECMLHQWKDEKPSAQSLDIIIHQISEGSPVTITRKPSFSFWPMINIAFSLVCVLALAYFVQSKITLLSIWQTIESNWFVQAVGSFGCVLVLFFAVGSFIALSIAPILLFDSQKIDHLYLS